MYHHRFSFLFTIASRIPIALPSPLFFISTFPNENMCCFDQRNTAETEPHQDRKQLLEKSSSSSLARRVVSAARHGVRSSPLARPLAMQSVSQNSAAHPRVIRLKMAAGRIASNLHWHPIAPINFRLSESSWNSFLIFPVDLDLGFCAPRKKRI